MQSVAGQDVDGEGIHQRLQRRRRRANPTRQGRGLQAHPVASEDLGLTIERQASRAEESHPRALPEPYVSLSAHTAPSVRP